MQVQVQKNGVKSVEINETQIFARHMPMYLP